MNIILRELKANFKSFLLWCIGIIAIVAGNGQVCRIQFIDQSISSIMDKVPRALLAFWNEWR